MKSNSVKRTSDNFLKKIMMIEDYERAQCIDMMYIQERQREEEELYWQWEEEQAKLPAQIVILNPIEKEEIK